MLTTSLVCPSVQAATVRRPRRRAATETTGLMSPFIHSICNQQCQITSQRIDFEIKFHYEEIRVVFFQLVGGHKIRCIFFGFSPTYSCMFVSKGCLNDLNTVLRFRWPLSLVFGLI